MVIDGGSNSGSATLMSIIINIDDFRGCDQIESQFYILFIGSFSAINIDEGSFY
jgi:hypothetical protein